MPSLNEAFFRDVRIVIDEQHIFPPMTTTKLAFSKVDFVEKWSMSPSVEPGGVEKNHDDLQRTELDVSTDESDREDFECRSFLCHFICEHDICCEESAQEEKYLHQLQTIEDNERRHERKSLEDSKQFSIRFIMNLKFLYSPLRRPRDSLKVKSQRNNMCDKGSPQKPLQLELPELIETSRCHYLLSAHRGNSSYDE